MEEEDNVHWNEINPHRVLLYLVKIPLLWNPVKKKYMVLRSPNLNNTGAHGRFSTPYTHLLSFFFYCYSCVHQLNSILAFFFFYFHWRHSSKKFSSLCLSSLSLSPFFCLFIVLGLYIFFFVFFFSPFWKINLFNYIFLLLLLCDMFANVIYLTIYYYYYYQSLHTLHAWFNKRILINVVPSRLRFPLFIILPWSKESTTIERTDEFIRSPDVLKWLFFIYYYYYYYFLNFLRVRVRVRVCVCIIRTTKPQ